jgi:hypothetical protein
MVARKVFATLAACSFSGAALGQESEADTEAADPTSAVADEIVVKGGGLETLRGEIVRAEDAVFARFNEINSNDDFDISCRSEVELGSRIPKRVCRAEFWREAEVDMAAEAVAWLQGSAYAGNTTGLGAGAMAKAQVLRAEVRRLAAEDEQFRAALTRLGTAHQAMAEEFSESTAPTASRQVPVGEQGLPYGAANVVEVRMGREPWTQALTRRTFTLARVYGEIREVDLACENRDARLQYEIGMEWTIPDTWGSCTLTVDAARDTTFALYEFD